MAITPIQYIQPEPHVPLGQKISALNVAADQSILNQQNIKANKLKLASAEQAAKDESGLNAVIKAGGDDQTMLDSSRNVSAGAYTQLREMLAKASKADLEKIKANTDAKKSFYDLMADRVMTINNAPEENRAILWKNIVAGMKSSGIPDAANLPDQYDPVIAGQYVDAKKQLDFLKSELDINIAKGNEAAKIVERDTAQAKTLAEIENSKTTPATKEFNDRFYKEFLPEKGIDPKNLNAETEGKLRAELRAKIESNELKYEPVKIKVDGKGPVAALQDQHGRYIDATTRKPITGKIDVYERPLASDTVKPPNMSLVKTVIEHPELYDKLSVTDIADIAPELAKQGFTGFGKEVPIAAVNKMSESRSAIASLRDLRTVLVDNEQYIGPIVGIGALNPYSEARKAQADIDRTKQRVGKALEGGVLRKEDEDKYKKILATLSDEPDTAIYKTDQMIEDIERDIQIYANELRNAGRRVDGGKPKLPKGDGKLMDPATAAIFFKEAGNNKAAAIKLAEENGWVTTLPAK